MIVALDVNGTRYAVDVEPRTTLLDCLRDHLGLTGAHAGCEHGVCGACTVLLDGAAARSCLMFAVQADGIAITTIKHMALNLIRRARGKDSLRLRRKVAAWDDDFLASLIAA